MLFLSYLRELIKYKNPKCHKQILSWCRFFVCWKADTFLHVWWWLYLHRKLSCISLQNLRIVSVMILLLMVEFINVKNNFIALNDIINVKNNFTFYLSIILTLFILSTLFEKDCARISYVCSLIYIFIRHF